MMDFNWFGFITVILLPIGVIIGMTVVLLRDYKKAKKRNERCHREISDWRDYGKENKK